MALMVKKGIIMLLVLCATMGLVGCGEKSKTEQQVIDEVTQKAISLGLKDVVVNVDGITKEYNIKRVSIECSNLEEFSFNEIFEIDNTLNDIDEVLTCNYTSNGNKYSIFPDTKQIYKNGDEIFNDYFNSDTHKSVVEKENEDYDSLSYRTVTDDDTLGEVWAMAQSFVKDNLKSPKSADFPVYSDSQVGIKESGNYYKVTGYVDAENSFGAEVRATFSLVMEKSGSKYTLKECNIYE